MKTRKLFFVMLAVLVTASLCITAALADGTPQIIVGNVEEAHPGDTVDVSVSLANNPGINTFTLQVDYDTARLKLTGVTPAADLGGTFLYDLTTERVGWQAGNDTTANTVFFTLSFLVLDDAGEGAASVSISYEVGNICNYDEEDVNFTVVPATVTVKAAEEPIESTTPVTPVEPTDKPVEPTTPVTPVEPTDKPVEPTTPVTPVEPTDKPDETTAPVTPVEPTDKPDETATPVGPVEPDDPADKPDETTPSDTTTSEKPAASDNKLAENTAPNSPDDVPKTGDETNIALWAALLALCAVGCAGAAVLTRKSRQR